MSHWGVDTVIGKGHSGTLVTMVERKTLYTLMTRVYGKCADGVTLATIKLLEPFIDRTHTITSDNGKEFAYHKNITEALGADFSDEANP